MTSSYVYDTYAIIEIIKGNKNYKNYTNQKIIINNFIYAELCYSLIKGNYPNASFFLDKYKKHIISISPETIKEAMMFRYKNKKKKMSMADCISYLLAKHLGIKFLTGDKEFENIENVEFVK